MPAVYVTSKARGYALTALLSIVRIQASQLQAAAGCTHTRHTHATCRSSCPAPPGNCTSPTDGDNPSGGGACTCRCGSPKFSKAASSSSPGDANLLVFTNISWDVPAAQASQFCSGPKIHTERWLAPASNASLVTFNGTLQWQGVGRQCPASMYCTPQPNPNFGHSNFDNLLYSMLMDFTIMANRGWSGLMYSVQQAVNDFAWIYFVAILLVLTHVVMSLVVAVMFQEYSKQQARHAAAAAAAEGSQGKALVVDMADIPNGSAISKDAAQAEPGCGSSGSIACWANVSAACTLLSEQPWFSTCLDCVVVVNMLLLAMVHAGMPDALARTIQYGNYACTGIFAMEMVVKLVGLGCRGYCEDKMNLLDGFVVLASVTEIVVDVATQRPGTTSLSIFRALR